MDTIDYLLMGRKFWKPDFLRWSLQRGTGRPIQVFFTRNLEPYPSLSKQSPLPENTWQYRPQAMNNGGVGNRSSLDAAFGGGMPGAGGKQMSRIMGGGGMVPPPAGMGRVCVLLLVL